jgi:hypothetical protein
MKDRKSFDLIYVQCSKDSIFRFIKLFLTVNPTDYWFHQTLTFKQRMTDKKLGFLDAGNG